MTISRTLDGLAEAQSVHGRVHFYRRFRYPFGRHFASTRELAAIQIMTVWPHFASKTKTYRNFNLITLTVTVRHNFHDQAATQNSPGPLTLSLPMSAIRTTISRGSRDPHTLYNRRHSHDTQASTSRHHLADRSPFYLVTTILKTFWLLF